MSKLVSDFGSGFPLMQRQLTIDTLLNGDTGQFGVLDRFQKFCNNQTDRNVHPIPVLACGPGTGKSRFLQEVGNMLLKRLKSHIAFSNLLSVYLTYGNSTPASQTDVILNGQASIASRLLYEYFISSNHSKAKIAFEDIQNSPGVTNLTLHTAINVIYLDFTRRVASNTPTVPPVLVLGIDEVNHFHDRNEDAFKDLVHAIGQISCRDQHPFCIPILAGTIEGPLELLIKESTYVLLQLPLPLLTDDDVIEIGKTLSLTRGDIRINLPEEYLQNNTLFRRTIADIGGMARAIEIFYREFMKQMDKGTKIPTQAMDLVDYLNHLDVVEVMRYTSYELTNRYAFDKYVQSTGPALANAILDIPVNINDKSGSITYKELRSAGIINLAGGPLEYYVRIPYLSVILLTQAAQSSNPRSSPWRFLKKFFDPRETISWSGFEVFNMNFWALRICLFSFLGKHTLTLSELFNGAEFIFASPNLQVRIPDRRKVSVHQLRDSFPQFQKPKDFNNVSHQIKKEFNKVFISGRNAPIDGHWLCPPGPTSSNLVIGFQMKLAEEESSKKLSVVDNQLILAEQPNIVRFLGGLNTNSKFVFAFMSNRHRSRSLELSEMSTILNTGRRDPIDIVLVHRENFARFYGYTFAGRAQFSGMWLIPSFSISLI